MNRVVLVVVLVVLVAGAAVADPVASTNYHVRNIGLGADLTKVFAAFGTPQAVQIVDNDKESGGGIQLLYFQGYDSLSIYVSDLPDNKVIQIEVSGSTWNTDTPVRVGDRVEVVMAKLGTPDKQDDLTTQKNWMLEQAGSNAMMRQLIEKNSGDTACWYQQKGICIEYDKSQKVVKSIKIFDPMSRFPASVNKI